MSDLRGLLFADGKPIATRLRRLIFALWALLVLLSLVTIEALQVQTAEVDRLTRVIGPAFNANGEALQAMTDAEAGLLGYQASGDVALLGPYRGAADHTAAALKIVRNGLEQTSDFDADRGQHAALETKQEKAAAAWWSYARRTEKAVAKGESTTFEGGKNLFDRFRSANADLGAHLRDERDVSLASARDTLKQQKLVVGLACLFAMVLGLLGGQAAARSFSRPITELRSVLRKQREGDGSARARVDQGSSEVRSLAEDLNALTDQNLGLQEIQAGDLRMNKLTFEIARAIRGASSTQRALDSVCEALGQGLGVDRVVANTFDAQHELLLGAEWHGPDLPPLGDIPDDMAPQVGRLAEELWLSSERLTLDDLSAPQVKSLQSAEFFSRESGAHALMVIPIGLGDRAMGMIYITVDHPRAWTQSEGRTVQQVAGFVGRAIVEDDLRAHQSEYVERLEWLDRHKTDFLATVSHELRTPLTSITGYLELLQAGDAGDLIPEQLRMLEVIDRNTGRLRGLIEDLLVLNRIESGGLMANVVGVSMRALITDAGQELAPLAADGAIDIDIDAGPQAAIVQGDMGQLHRAIVNIVSNAIKFSCRGGVITIRCTLDEAAGRVLVTCQDRGIGIPADDQARLFTRFFRARNATDQAIPGTGLGLSIVKQIVEDHGGELQLTSVEGEGTIVVMDLPLSDLSFSDLSLSVVVPAPADGGNDSHLDDVFGIRN
jgi:two-component system, OmpR family, phosphate regulon sensor histidine kinase PhoR